jgi:hypothetical protein
MGELTLALTLAPSSSLDRFVFLYPLIYVNTRPMQWRRTAQYQQKKRTRKRVPFHLVVVTAGDNVNTVVVHCIHQSVL